MRIESGPAIGLLAFTLCIILVTLAFVRPDLVFTRTIAVPGLLVVSAPNQLGSAEATITALPTTPMLAPANPSPLAARLANLAERLSNQSIFLNRLESELLAIRPTEFTAERSMNYNRQLNEAQALITAMGNEGRQLIAWQVLAFTAEEQGRINTFQIALLAAETSYRQALAGYENLARLAMRLPLAPPLPVPVTVYTTNVYVEPPPPPCMRQCYWPAPAW